MQFPSSSPQHGGRVSPRPPAYQAPPPSGFRVPLELNSTFPPHELALDTPCRDLDGSPVYFGSALFPSSVHPCKIAPHIDTPCRVPYGGQEQGHRGRYDLLPFTHEMELVPTSGGRIPPGRRPVEGGYEEPQPGKPGQKLYHAVARHRHDNRTVLVPGKVGEHLVRSMINVREDYSDAEVPCREVATMLSETQSILRPNTSSCTFFCLRCTRTNLTFFFAVAGGRFFCFPYNTNMYCIYLSTNIRAAS